MSILVPEGCTLIPIDSIDIASRDRQDFGNIEALASNIKKYGLIHPPTVTKDAEGKITLLAGGRRLKAFQLLQQAEVPVLFREAMSEAQVHELEFWENGARKGFTWQEECVKIYNIHKLRAAEASRNGRPWGYRDTAEYSEWSLGHISHAVQVAKLVLEGDEELLAAKSIKDAYTNVILARKDKAITQKLGGSGLGTVVEHETPKPKPKSTKPQITIGPLERDESDAIFDTPGTPAPTPTAGTDQNIKHVEFPISEWFFHGDFRKVVKDWKDGCVDHVVTDIPYGIDMKNLDQLVDIDAVVDAHDVDANVELMPEFLRQSYRLIKDNGYCVFWYDLDHHEKLQKWATEAGFKVQRWPLVWHKRHKCKNNQAQFNWTKSVEFAMVCRKGMATLNDSQDGCVVEANGAIERQLYTNPFAKPAAAWEFILKAIGLKGQTILDPFGGQFSCARTVINLGMKPMSVELEEYHYQHGITQIKSLLNEISGGKAKFV